ncbi:probable addiction module antidote protein [Pseudomonas sp. NFACC04-2]|jgi:probable addiction module antidote protein|nr:probable addiction module antidote protein [Pseudomonas sp. NFACC04-2]
MIKKFSRFDAATYLKTPEEMKAYLDACFEEDNGDGVLIRAALNDIARAERMTRMVYDSNLEQPNID